MGNTTDDAIVTAAAWIVTSVLVSFIGAGLAIFVHPIAGLIGAIVVIIVMFKLLRNYYRREK